MQHTLRLQSGGKHFQEADKSFQFFRDGTAIKKSDLPVNGKDLQAVGMQGKKIGEYLDALWHECLAHPEVNDRDLVLERLNKWQEKTEARKKRKDRGRTVDADLGMTFSSDDDMERSYGL